MALINVGDDLSLVTLKFEFENLKMSDFPQTVSQNERIIFKSDNDHELYYYRNFIGSSYVEIKLRNGYEDDGETPIIVDICKIEKIDDEDVVTIYNKAVTLGTDFGVITYVNEQSACYDKIILDHTKFYVFCENMCREEGLTKEQILYLFNKNVPKIVVLTQEEYDALENPDEGTYYFIKED